jgi:hypothetical protein
MALAPIYLTPEQNSIIQQPVNAHIFLEGPAGTGKTTVGVERILYLLMNGIPANKILLIVPQRTLATPYYQMLRSPGVPPGGTVNILTIGGLAKRMVDLFWPMIADHINFANPNKLPTFLTLEGAQYYMAHLVRPLFAEGLFDSLTIDRNRIYSQILDNLNKAAAVGFPHTEISRRLQTAWVGEPAQARIYEDAQYCANLFRDFCLEHNLLDYSLQLEIFRKHLWSLPICHDYLINEHRHLVLDNLEEDIPVTFDLLNDWLPDLDSSMLIFDQDGGYRQFLSADPKTNYALRDNCNVHANLSENFIASEKILAFGETLFIVLNPPDKKAISTKEQSNFTNLPVFHSPLEIKYYPEMLDWVAEEITALIDSGYLPGDIVVLAPYLSDSLRYSLVSRLEQFRIPVRSHRPSRALREEPASQCLLTLAMLANPQWGLHPPKSEVAHALIQALDGFDIVRSQLLVNIVYQKGELCSFSQIKPEIQERITYIFGGRFEKLRDWLYSTKEGSPEQLDHFLSRLFGEVLSQPGFGFHANYNAASVAANLVESIKKFRWATGDLLSEDGFEIGKEYIEMVQDGVIAAQYLGSWSDQPEDAVYIAPAYTFLVSNRPVDIQFWLDVGSRGWYERLYQPLTHPHVLSRHWIDGTPWTDTEEYTTNLVALQRLVLGLTRRCRQAIYLGLSSVNEQGYENKGELLRCIDRALSWLI